MPDGRNGADGAGNTSGMLGKQRQGKTAAHGCHQHDGRFHY